MAQGFLFLLKSAALSAGSSLSAVLSTALSAGSSREEAGRPRHWNTQRVLQLRRLLLQVARSFLR